MARIRSIKPEIMEKQRSSELSDAAWRLWVCAWMLADDAGNLPASPGFLAGRVFWARPDADVKAALAELHGRFLIPYTDANGTSYYHIRHFRKHQRIDKPGPAKCPPCPFSDGSFGGPDQFDEHSRNVPGEVVDSSWRDGKGREGKGTGEERERSARAEEPSAADPVATTVAEMQAAAASVGAAWTRHSRQKAAATVRALGSDGHGPAVVLAAWRRFCADVFWFERGLPVGKFLEHFPKYAATPKPHPAEGAARRAVGKPPTEWCACGVSRGRHDAKGRPIDADVDCSGYTPRKGTT